MSLRSLLNDEPQDPISALPPRTPTTSSALPSLVTSAPSTPLRTGPNTNASVPFPAYDTQDYRRPAPSASPRFPNGDSPVPPSGFNDASPKRPKKKSRVQDAVGYPNGHDAPSMDVDIPLTNTVSEEPSYGSSGRSNLVSH